MFALTFLGTSASVPSAERNHPGLLIEAGSQRILVDCGEGTQRQLFRGAGFRRLDRLLLTHGHFDHVLGIPGLFSTLRLRRSADLMTIHGSPGTLDVVIPANSSTRCSSVGPRGSCSATSAVSRTRNGSCHGLRPFMLGCRW
jgi:ribonuclease BN (tRNA processing enzyme)